MSRWRMIGGLIGACGGVAVVFAGTTAVKAQDQQDESSSRGVHIIEAPSPPPAAVLSPSPLSPAPEKSAPALLTPVPSISSPPPGSSAAEPLPTPQLPGNEIPGPATQQGSLTSGLNGAITGSRPTLQNIEGLSNAAKLPNAAGLAMQILPGPDIAIGSQVSIQVSSRKPGYLILVDIDVNGRLAQIYPNPMSLMLPGGIRENLNLLRPGKPMQIPDPQNPFAGFQLVASPPAGTAMVLALLSERPVQLIDLPDVPAQLLGSASAADYLSKIANELRIPGVADRLDEAHWSFDVKFYAIR